MDQQALISNISIGFLLFGFDCVDCVLKLFIYVTHCVRKYEAVNLPNLLIL